MTAFTNRRETIGSARTARRGSSDEAALSPRREGLLRDLRARLDELGSVVVAYSGGADSSLLAVVADQVLHRDALAVMAVSPSLPTAERRDGESVANEWGFSFLAVSTSELENAAYRRNDPDRCYHCKAELMSVVAPIADQRSATVVLGVNLDDLDDHRPGQRAASEAGAVFPFVDVGCSKSDVRAIARALGLRTWNKPAAACLASRIPHGTEVSVQLLGRVERAETVLRGLGCSQCRVRHHGDVARIEVDPVDFETVVAARDELVATFKRLGYRYVTVDLEGFRSGSLNPATLRSTP